MVLNKSSPYFTMSFQVIFFFIFFFFFLLFTFFSFFPEVTQGNFKSLLVNS